MELLQTTQPPFDLSLKLSKVSETKEAIKALFQNN
jgi:hypothetical protein